MRAFSTTRVYDIDLMAVDASFQNTPEGVDRTEVANIRATVTAHLAATATDHDLLLRIDTKTGDMADRLARIEVKLGPPSRTPRPPPPRPGSRKA